MLDKFWYLRQIKFFQRLDDVELQSIASLSTPLEFRRKEMVFSAYEANDHVYLIFSGRIKLYKLSEDGREITLDILDGGDIFGELALTQSLRREIFAEALDDTVICQFNTKEFVALLESKPELAIEVARAMSTRLRQSQRKIEDLAFNDVSTRLARLLIEYSEKHGEVTEEGIHINIDLTHQEMANLIGTARETLTAMLNKLVDTGMVRTSRRSVTILNSEVLRNLAGLTPLPLPTPEPGAVGKPASSLIPPALN